ncbi:MFS transporter [Desulfurivibrio alkaliphilus]|uniref:Major facilitator superfamily MFS_1 n=1 Tax=Desulfurivibrio alkaliphilus (strain DSM 19089 / UNIQEM U267 / AHT2) TaxID=589865 RepID=D6Z3V3_DESAT|nr:MFS transporter [Desulfurivibrio alkaliphilus]ADH86228.1 major facilitator superfamily MFS_1 [Desulfurivibrio alkaliphilus AHT 2]
MMIKNFFQGFGALFAVHPRLALFPLAAVATSSFGQTFYVSVFGEELRDAFNLSHTMYGGLYSGATLVSALLLLRFGPLADTWPLNRAVNLAVVVLALGCLLIGLAPGVWLLFAGFVLIRFGGQGFVAHLGMTAAARYFAAHRGKAVALGALGIPLGEALLPAAAVLLMTRGDWRWPWLAAVLFLLLVILPLLRTLSRETPAPAKAAAADPAGPQQFTRAEVLREPGFYFLLPAVMATPFVVTAMLFHQSALVILRGWSLELLAGAFVVFAVGHLLSLVVAGPLVDRLGSHRSLPLALLPMFGGLLLLAAFTGPWVLYCYLALLGASIGLATTAGGTIWADRYGVLHLGAIRSLVHAAIVFSTAVAPILAGLLLDSGLGVPALALAMAAYCLIAATLALAAPASPKAVAS